MITRRTAANRVTALASVPLLGLAVFAALTVAGCGTATSSAAPGSGTKTSASAAPTVTQTPVPPVAPSTPPGGGGTVSRHPSCTDWPTHVASGPLPTSFQPVAVIRCVTDYQTIPGKGEWLVATLQRADKNLTALISALHRPPGRMRPGAICPALAMVPPQIVLISGNGSMINPKIPLNGCGQVQQQVIAALVALPWKTISVRLVSQVESPQQVATGCAPRYINPFATFGSAPPSPGGAVFTTRPASLRICMYGSGGGGGGGGGGGDGGEAQFARGATVTGTTESALLAGLTSARQAGTCTPPRASFAIVSDGGSQAGPSVFVELGGCDRVLRYGSQGNLMTALRMGQATPAAVAIIESAIHPKP
jgi:hypothetical protein